MQTLSILDQFGPLVASVLTNPVAVLILTLLALASVGCFLLWFTRLPRNARRDVIRLARAIRGTRR